MLDGELVFVPGEIPRRGVFAHWGRGTGSAKLELVFPGGRYGIRKRLVSADLIPLAEALPALAAVGAREQTRLSVQAWAAAAAAGVGLIARGRLLPTVGTDDTDIWRAGPLDPADLSWMRQLAAAFPPAAHALAVPGSRPMRLRSPEALIRDLWDARPKPSGATGSPPETSSCASAGTCAGTRTLGRTRTGNLAAPPIPIRPWPWRASEAGTASGVITSCTPAGNHVIGSFDLWRSGQAGIT